MKRAPVTIKDGLCLTCGYNGHHLHERESSLRTSNRELHELNNAVELLRTALNQYDAEASVGLPTTDRFGMDRRARTRQFLVAYDRKRA